MFFVGVFICDESVQQVGTYDQYFLHYRYRYSFVAIHTLLANKIDYYKLRIISMHVAIV